MQQQQKLAPATAPGIRPTHTHTRLAYPVKEGAQLLGVSVWTLRDLFYNGKLRAHRLGGKLLIPASEIDRILAETLASYQPATSGIGVIAPAHNQQRAADRRRRESARATTKRARPALTS